MQSKDHLGNVRATITDLKMRDGAKYKADLSSANTYYPFGMLMPERNWSSEWYRYGFQGQEKDDEIKGEGNSINLGARMYDSRLIKTPSIDSHVFKYPKFSPYTYAANNPIYFIDPDGNDVMIAFTGGFLGQGNPIKMYDAGTTGKILAEANLTAIMKNIEFDGLVIESGVTSGPSVSNAYDFIKKHYTGGERLIIYGYSCGGDFAVELAEKLHEDYIQIDLLITVDANDGPFQNSKVNSSIPDNVKRNVNYYQTKDSGNSSSSALSNKSTSNSSSNTFGNSNSDSGTLNFPGSNGGLNSANSKKTKVLNNNETRKSVNHENIDEKVQPKVNNEIKNVIESEK